MTPVQWLGVWAACVFASLIAYVGVPIRTAFYGKHLDEESRVLLKMRYRQLYWIQFRIGIAVMTVVIILLALIKPVSIGP
ncbi:MAG: hypothetical protein Tsb0013_13710 [Phycisphaerales bacterium]